jgi:hypothetical protein
VFDKFSSGEESSLAGGTFEVSNVGVTLLVKPKKHSKLKLNKTKQNGYDFRKKKDKQF